MVSAAAANLDRHYSVPFGRGSLEFTVPEGLQITLIEPARSGRESDSVNDLVAAAIANPVGSAPLRELARGAKSVTIAVTDATRACPDWLLVPPMLVELEAAGVPDDAITILVAVGTHRASTEAEKREKLGDAVVDAYRVVDHDASDTDSLRFVLDGPAGIPFMLNRLITEADLVLATGLVEPHQYAGFSGGGKTVTIGCANEAIIAYTHGPTFLDDPGTRLAQLEGNKFQSEVRRVAKAASVRFVANCVLDEYGNVCAVRYGHSEVVQDELADIARKQYTTLVSTQADIAIAGVGYPKDENLYQASRAASYLQFAPTPLVGKGGVLIIPAACPEGAGAGPGEQRFGELMRSKSAKQIIDEARRDGIRPGEQRAYVMSLVLRDVSVIIVGAERPQEIEAMGFLVDATIEAALQRAIELTNANARLHIVPHALQTLPVVSPESSPRSPGPRTSDFGPAD